MSSLTPESRRAEATSEAANEGYVNGLLTLIPSSAAVYMMTQRSAAFARRTNFQSRTALAIMPALLVFGVTSELKLIHKMNEIAQESSHSRETVEWAERQRFQAQLQDAVITPSDPTHLTQLYKQSVENSGVRIVPGDTLSPYHTVANYTAANPIKVLAAMAVPSVAWIFYGRSGKEHLDFSVKLLHTRVFGQFATLSLLLGVMGYKEYHDNLGKFITQKEADRRVAEMHMVREALMERLEEQQKVEQEYRQVLKKAHEEDLKEGNNHGKKHKGHKKKLDHGLQTLRQE